MYTLLLTIMSLLGQPSFATSYVMADTSDRTSQLMQQPQPRRSSRPADQSKPLPDTTQKKGKPKQPASVDSLRRGGATRVDTVRA